MLGRLGSLIAVVCVSSALAGPPVFGPPKQWEPIERSETVEAPREPVAEQAVAEELEKETPAVSDAEALPLPEVERTPIGAGAAEQRPASSGWFGVLAPLALVVGLILVAGVVIRRVARSGGGLASAFGAGGRAPAGVIEVLGRYPVAHGQTLVLLKVDRRVLLLGQSRVGRLGGAAFNTLAEFTDPDEVASLLVKTRDDAGETMARRFSGLLGNEDNAFDPTPVVRHASLPERDGAIGSLRRRLDAMRTEPEA